MLRALPKDNSFDNTYTPIYNLSHIYIYIYIYIYMIIIINVYMYVDHIYIAMVTCMSSINCVPDIRVTSHHTYNKSEQQTLTD